MGKTPVIAVLGSLNMDIVVKSSRFPVPGETISGQEVHFVPGGKGGNQAVAAARLGAEVRMIGFVGNDSFGDDLLRSLAESGVNTNGVQRAPFATGIASIVLADNDNQIIVVPGANGYCLPANITDLEEQIAAADILLMQLEVPLETICCAAELAKKHHKTVVLNPAPAMKLPDELLQLADYITPNETELYALTGLKADEASLEEAIDSLLAQGPGCVVATLGEKGSIYKQKNKAALHMTAYQVEVVDTTGAGDSYNAALTFGIASGYDEAAQLQLATSVSALAVTRFGAQPGMPTIEDVQQFLGNNNEEKNYNFSG
ncbi:ribokinase [Paenibacillus sp. IITD108]|uniref:ribokinase n=1 Tax=Paenibacillus sp. IITD108 TaxID=3116649 RepID=UPI002F41D285